MSTKKEIESISTIENGRQAIVDTIDMLKTASELLTFQKGIQDYELASLRIVNHNGYQVASMPLGFIRKELSDLFGACAAQVTAKAKLKLNDGDDF